MSPTFETGALVTWRQQHRGGYGYVTPVNATVTGVTAKRIQIRVYTKGGDTRYLWVRPENISRRPV